MPESLKLLCVLAHPDDETLGNGPMLTRYAAEGVETHLVCATRGERGWMGAPQDNPGPAALGRTRAAELQAAAKLLGLRSVEFLDYMDGDLDQAATAEAVGRIVGCLRRRRPQVVVTFPPDGAYGHPDHIAISQFTTAALVCAADASYTAAPGAPHRVSKLYFMVSPDDELMHTYQAVFGDLVMPVDGIDRRMVHWPDWAVTSVVEDPAHWAQVRDAVACHKSQIAAYGALLALPEETHRTLWSSRPYYRVFSLVNGGRRRESDLFEGLR
jgi:LmbE family N-acetylglucosaminyl deacetylase